LSCGRPSINAERGSYATRDYVDTVNSSTDGRLKALEQGKSYVIGWVAAIAATFVMYFVSHR
jgi:hypothetical protein